MGAVTMALPICDQGQHLFFFFFPSLLRSLLHPGSLFIAAEWGKVFLWLDSSTSTPVLCRATKITWGAETSDAGLNFTPSVCWPIEEWFFDIFYFILFVHSYGCSFGFSVLCSRYTCHTCHYVAKFQVRNFFVAILFLSLYLKRSPTAQSSIWLSRWYPDHTTAANTTFHWGAINRGWPTLLQESQLRLRPLDQPATWRQHFCLLLILNLDLLRATAEQSPRSFRNCTNTDFHSHFQNNKTKINIFRAFSKKKKQATTLKAVRKQILLICWKKTMRI